MNAGDIKVGLTLDNNSFKVEMQRAGVLIKQFQQNLESTSKSVKNIENHTAGFSARMRHAVTTISLARGALVNLNDLFLGVPRAVAGASGEIERMTKLMEGLAKSSREVVNGNKTAKETAKEWTGYVFEMSKNAPFEVNAITDSFVKLKTAGLDPTDGSLKALVDSVAKYGGTSEQLKRASVAIQQMGGKGVISMEELRQQLGEAVPDAIQLMSTGVGMAMKDLVKKISLGQVEAASALDRMFTMMRIKNDGAAQAMMETWTGQLSRLKTNITLLLNDIGNAGGDEASFFAEIKKQIKALNAEFDGPQMKRFAADLGESFATIVRGAAETIKFIAKFSEEIKGAAQALLIFWAAKKGMGVLMDIKNAYDVLRTTMVSHANEQIAANNREVAAEIAKNKQKLADNQAYYAQLRAMESSFRSAAMANRATMAAIERRQGYIGTRSNTYKNAASDLATNAAAAASLNSQAAAAQRASIAIRQVGESQARMLTSTTSMISKLPILGTAMGLLGGPIGIITMAITAGIYAWFNWGKAAKEAIEQANRAVRDGEARNVDVNALSDKIKAQKQLIDSIQDGGIATTADEISFALSKDKKAALKKLQDDLKVMEKQHATAIGQARFNEVQDAVRLNQKYNDVFLTQSKTRQEQQLSALQAETEKKKEIASKEGGDLTKIELEYGKKLKDIAVKSATERSEYLVRSIALVSARIKTANQKELESLNAQKDNLTKIKNDIDTELAAANRLGSVNLLGGKAAGSGADGVAGNLSPIQKFIQKLQEQDAQVKSTAEQLNDGRSAIKSYVAEFDAMVATGQFKGKKSGNPGQGELDIVREMAAKLDADRAANAQLSKFNNFMDGMRERIAVLNGELSKNGGEGAVQKFLKQLEQDGFSGDKLAEATRMVYDFQEAMEAKNIDQNIIKTENAIAGLKEELYGGMTAAGKMNAEIERLSKLNLNPANLAQLERLKALLNEQRDLGDVKVIREVTTRARQKTNEVLLGNATEEQAIRIRYQEELRLIEETYAKLSDVEARKVEVVNARNAEIKAANDKLAQDLRSPAERMVRSWQDSTARMKEASADWTKNFIDEMVEMADTGKFRFGDMVNSILKDMYRIALQKQLGGAVQGIFDTIATSVGGAIQNGQTGAQTTGLVDMARTGLERFTRALGFGKDSAGNLGVSMEKSATEAVTQAANSVTSSTALNNMTGAATAAAQALQALAQSAGASAQASVAGSSGGGGFFDSLLGSIGGIFGGSADVAPSASYGGILGMEGVSSGSSWWPFANGGIMTKFGSAQLKKYANGGIANSPQVALYGEGSRPEAYVPLPDGRTIPVTMSGMGGGVVVNVINNASGTQAREERTQNADGTMSIDVIIEQVEGKISQNLSKGKGSLSTVMEKTYGLNRAAGSYR
jgi:tape measure domain-containing protein